MCLLEYLEHQDYLSDSMARKGLGDACKTRQFQTQMVVIQPNDGNPSLLDKLEQRLNI